MDTYIKEDFDNELYRVKHIAGTEAYNPEKPTYHGNGMLILSYYIKGHGSMVIDSTRYEITGGDLFIMKPTEFFRHKIDEGCFHERIVLIIYPQILKNLPACSSALLYPFFKHKSKIKNHIPSHLINKHCLDKLFMELLTYSKEGSETGSTLAFSRILEILAVTNKIITKVLTDNTINITSDSKVNDILKYLNYNFTADISIIDVAREFNLDRSYLSRLFKENIGMSMWDYVIMRRIYLFNYLIKDSNSVEETAYKAGFKNYSNFYRLYKKHMLMSPNEFKKSLYTP